MFDLDLLTDLKLPGPMFDDILKKYLHWGALMTASCGTLFILLEPCRHMIVVSTMTANLAPKVHTFHW